MHEINVMASPRRILIVCDASPSIGFGHLVRSRAIADVATSQGILVTLVGPSRRFMGSEDESRFENWIESSGDEPIDWPDWIVWIADTAEQLAITHVMLDSYTVPGEWQFKLRQRGLRVLHQYDASAPPAFAADLAVNASPAETASLHAGRMLHSDVQFLNGPRYAVIRREFADVDRKPAGRPVNRILVTFGGGNDRGGISLAIRSLAPVLPSGVRLTVMTSGQNPNIATLQDLVNDQGFDNVDLEINHPDAAGLIASCDMAVMAGGTSIYEAAFCGLPMALISIAANQHGQCRGWEDLGAARYLGRVDEGLGKQLTALVLKLLDDKAARRNMALAGQENVDLGGAARLLEALCRG
jgi:UDP-2,4-diacetamido-2,4,6-trideoxy-beta-L-altropyranose hydrolase